MKKKLFLSLLITLTIFTGFSQDKAKIKGSRNVTTVITELDNFERIVVGENFKIKLIQGISPSIEVNADDNLHEAIEFTVQDGSLKFKTNKRITSSKKLEIIVIFKDSINTLEVKDDAEVSSVNTLQLNNLTLITSLSSKAFLTLKTDLFKLVNSDKSNIELNLTANKATLELNDNSNIKALINASEIEVDLYQRASAKIEGDTNNLQVRADNTTSFRGEKLTSKECSLITEGRADVYVEASENLKIEASGTTETYIYGSPKIEITTFEDTAILRKR